MTIDKKFIKDAYKALKQFIEHDCLPPAGHWIWLEPNRVRLYRFDDCVEFVTSRETLRIELDAKRSGAPAVSKVKVAQ